MTERIALTEHFKKMIDRNHRLYRSLGKCRESRDIWKRKALERGRENKILRARVLRLEKRLPARRRRRPPNPYGLVKLSERDLRIVRGE